MHSTSPTPSAGAGEFGLRLTGSADAGTLIIIDATPVAVITTCPDCRHPGKKSNQVVRTLVDLPIVEFPTRLHVRVPRFTCCNPSCSWKVLQTALICEDDGSQLTRRVTPWIL